MATLGPDYADAEARFKSIREAAHPTDAVAKMQAAASTYAKQFDAPARVELPPSEAEQHLQFLRIANENAKNAGLPPINMQAAEAQVAAEKQTKAAEIDRAAAIAKSMPGVSSEMPAAPLYPPAPPLPVKSDGILDTDNMTMDQLSRLGYASVDPATVAMGQDAFNDSMRGIKHEQAAITQSIEGMKDAEKLADAAAMEQFETTAEKGKALTVATAEANRLSAEREAAVMKLVAESSAEVTAQMVRVRQTADDAANAQIKDFWADKSTGGRILGIISQALAGAANGLSGQPGASTPLDKIIAADLERQRINLNQKTTTSYREQGILGLMRQNFSSQLEAGAAAYGAAINHVDMLAKDIAQRFGTAEAKAAYDKFHAEKQLQLQQNYAQAHNALMASHIQTAQISSTMISKLTSANVAANAGLKKGAGEAGDLHILGLKGPVSKPVYAALHKSAADIGSVMSSYQRVQEMTKDGNQINENWRREFNQLTAEIFAATRNRFQTGKRLEGPEKAQVDTAVPQITSSMLSGLTPQKLFSFQKQLDAQMNATVRSYINYVKSVAPNDFDLNDPQIGPYIRRLATPAGAR